MRLKDNPFWVLNVKIDDNCDTIIDSAEEKSFMDDANTDKYEKARSVLISPLQRLEAEICWIKAIEKSTINDFMLKSSDRVAMLLNERELLIYYLEKLYRQCSFEDISEAIVKIDELYRRFLKSDATVLDCFNEINRNRKNARITLLNDVELLRNTCEKIWLADIENAFAELIKVNTSVFIINTANKVAEDSIGIEIETGKNAYGIVVEKFIGMYTLSINDTLHNIYEEVLDNIAEADSANDAGDLKLLFANVRKFDRLAQPIQLYLQAKGSANKQRESVEIAFKLRNLAITMHNENGKTDLSLLITKLLKELFSELPEIKALVEEDTATLTRLAKSDVVTKKCNEIAKEIKAGIVRDNNHIAQNASFFVSRKTRWDDCLTELCKKVVEDGYDEEACDSLAGIYLFIATSFTWANDWKSALDYILKGKEWALKSNNNELIKKYQEYEVEFSSVLKHEVTPKKDKPTDWEGIGSFCVLAFGIIFVLYMLLGSCAHDKKTSYNDTGSSKITSTNANSRSILTSASDLADEAMVLSKTTGSLDIFVGKGKVLVWDKSKNDTYTSENLRNEILWGRGDAVRYVCVIDSYYEHRVATYTNSNKSKSIPGYQREAVIYVYDLTKRICIGTTTITGEMPPDQISLRSTPNAIYGNIERPLTDWINKHFQN